LSSIGHLFHNGEIPNACEFTEVREEEVEPFSLTVDENGLPREGIHDGVMSVFHIYILYLIGGMGSRVFRTIFSEREGCSASYCARGSEIGLGDW